MSKYRLLIDGEVSDITTDVSLWEAFHAAAGALLAGAGEISIQKKGSALEDNDD